MSSYEDIHFVYDVKNFVRQCVGNNKVIDLRMLKAAALMMGAVELGEWVDESGAKHCTLFWPDTGRLGDTLGGAELRCVLPPKGKALDPKAERAILEKRIKYHEATDGYAAF